MGKPSANVSKPSVNLLISELLVNWKLQEMLIESHTLETIEWGELLAIRVALNIGVPYSGTQSLKYKYNPGVRIFWNKLKTNSFYVCTFIH